MPTDPKVDELAALAREQADCLASVKLQRDKLIERLRIAETDADEARRRIILALDRVDPKTPPYDRLHDSLWTVSGETVERMRRDHERIAHLENSIAEILGYGHFDDDSRPGEWIDTIGQWHHDDICEAVRNIVMTAHGEAIRGGDR